VHKLYIQCMGSLNVYNSLGEPMTNSTIVYVISLTAYRVKIQATGRGKLQNLSLYSGTLITGNVKLRVFYMCFSALLTTLHIL
jgi:hypothetical protein